LFDRHRLGLDDRLPGTDLRVGASLLSPHRSYLRTIEPLLARPGLHALAHITGGGLTDNLPRVLPTGTHCRIFLETWDTPAVFRALRDLGQVDLDEMLRVFNMGIGMVVVVDPAAREDAIDALERGGGEPVVIGRVEAGGAGVVYA
jgi:phosphoribosylformylglycinamidine cyclo-ligase